MFAYTLWMVNAGAKKVVSAYCRVSTDKDDQVNSLNNQVRFFSEYIAQNEDWVLGEVYFDEGLSGTSVKKRGGFARMIADGLCCKFDLVVTKEVSRFARNTVDTLTYTRRLKERGVGVLFLSDNINTLDSDGELRLTIMASLAQEESRKTSERVKWGQTRSMERGVVFGRDLLGYSLKNGKLVINEAEAETVRLIFYKYAWEGKGTWTIARELDDAGIRPKHSNRWSNSVILKILRNEKYVGDLCQKKTYTPDFLTHDKKHNDGAENRIFIANHHAPIVERDTFFRAQAELKRRSPSSDNESVKSENSKYCNFPSYGENCDPSGTKKSKHSNRYWCSGKVICGECGASFVSKTKKLDGGLAEYRAWRCYSAACHGCKKSDGRGGFVGCDNGSINDKALRFCVAFLIGLVKTDCDEITSRALAEIGQVAGQTQSNDANNIEIKLDRFIAKKKRAIELCIDGIISREELAQQMTRFDEEIGRLSKQLADCQNANGCKKADRMQTISAEIKKILVGVAESDLLCREHLEKVIVRKDKSLTIALKHIPYHFDIAYKKDQILRFSYSFDQK